MNDKPPTDVIAQQYSRWIYPKPAEDLAAVPARGVVGAHNYFHLFWPDRSFTEAIDILVAGCGTNQAALTAYTHPSARVISIDVSRASLAHEEHLKHKYNLRNLQLRALPIENVADLGCDFDLIVSTGVLHHMADPGGGMTALAGRLRRDGVIAVMLYGKYGRLDIDMMRHFYRLLGTDRTQEGVDFVRRSLPLLKP